MNILYISKLEGNMWAGPDYSVPAQIKAQSKIDTVFWYNLNKTEKQTWREANYFKNLNDYPNQCISELQSPFNRPDIIVFEGIYGYALNKKIIDEIWNSNIPYILIPRSSLTKAAQNKKRFKKTIANLLFFNKFITRAKSIQYLTESEFKNSGEQWNKNYFVIPNGIEPKSNTKVFENTNSKSLTGIYIGRLEIYQKGLDLLVEACSYIKKELKDFNCSIKLFGLNENNGKEKLQNQINDKKLQDFITIYDPIFGADKEKELLNSDFFIMTSRFEGHPMALIEALSYGLPCVVTEGTNLCKEIVEAKAGWGAMNEEVSIKNTIEQMSKNYHRNKVLYGENAIELSKKYAWSEIAKKTHQEYSKCIK